MKVGIIGAGAMAQSITVHAVRAGHDVMLSNSRGVKSLARVTERLTCLAGTARQAAEFGDIIILAIPLWAVASLPPEPFASKIVLDLLNYFPHRDGNVRELDHGNMTTSELVASHFPASRMVKAFNAITFDDLRRDARPAEAKVRRALPIAGDDADAKKIAAAFIDSVGFDVVDMGALADSWKIERFRPAYCVGMDRETLIRTLDATGRETRVSDGHWMEHRQISLD